VLRPEAERRGGVADLRGERVLVGLPGLRDDRANDPLGVVGHPPLGATQHPPAAIEPERLPAGLRPARPCDELTDAVGGGRRNRRDDVAGGGVPHLETVGRAPAVVVNVCVGRRMRHQAP
jgi:hypothetical protein